MAILFHFVIQFDQLFNQVEVLLFKYFAYHNKFF